MLNLLTVYFLLFVVVGHVLLVQSLFKKCRKYFLARKVVQSLPTPSAAPSQPSGGTSDEVGGGFSDQEAMQAAFSQFMQMMGGYSEDASD